MARRQLFHSTALRTGYATAFAAACLAFPSQAQAQDRIYAGPGTDWTDGANWNGGNPVDSPGETAVFQNNGAPTAIDVVTNVSAAGIRYEAAAPARTINIGALFSVFGSGIVNNSGNIQTITINGALQGSTSLQLAGSSDFTGTQTNVNVTRGFFQIAQTANATQAHAILDAAGILSLETSDGTATLGALSGSGTVTSILNNGAIANQVLTVGGLNLSTTFSGRITQNPGTTLGLVVAGTGTLTLTGNNNSYSGGTTINAGATLQLGNGGAGGTLGSGGVTVNGTLVFNRSDNYTIGNAISGTGAVTKAGAGTLTLTGANGYSGGTAINAGTVEVSNGAALGTGAITFSGTSALRGTSTLALTNNLVFTAAADATIAAAAGTTLTLNGSAFNINANTAGTELHFGSATDTGTVVFAPTLGVVAGGAGYGVFVDGGTLRAGNVNTLTFLTGLSSVNTTVAAGATLDYSPYGSGNINNLLGTGTVLDDGSTTSIRNANFGGVLAGTQNVSTVGTGLVILTGANTYTGTTTVVSGSTLQIGNGGTTGSIANTSGIVDNGTLTVDRSDAMTLAAPISGTGMLVKAGTGTLTVTGANTYSGGTNLQRGTLQVGSNNALGTGTLTFAGAGVATTLRGLNTVSLGNNLTFSNGADATIAAAAGTTLTLNGSAFNINANTAGTELHFGSATDTGTVVFAPTLGVVAGGAGYGVFVDGGTLRAGNVNTLTFLTGLSSVNTTVAAGATLDYSPYGSGNINNLLGTGTVLDDGSTTSIRNANFGGVLAGTQNVSTVGTGLVILTGANTYTGTTTVVSGSTLQIGNGGTTGSIANTSGIVDNGTLTVDRSDAMTLAAPISGTGMLVKAGTGTLTVTGANTYSGGTNLQRGTLQVGSNNALGTGTLTFAGAGVATTLRGLNTVSLGNNLTFSNGADATIAAAAGTTLTLNGSAFNINANTAGTELHFGSATDTGTVVFAPTLGVVAGGAGYGVFVDGGTLRAGNVNTLTFLTGLSSVNTTVAAGATLDYSPYGSGNINNLLGTGTVLDDGSTTSIRNANFGGVLAGTQNVSTVGTGLVILTGANTYTGTTTVVSGSTLQIGNGGTTGSIANTSGIVDNGTLTVDRSDAMTLAAPISGTGMLVKAGTGTLTVTGANTYSGGTNLQRGTLQVGSNNALGTGTLTFAGAGVATTLRGLNTVSLGNNLTFSNGADATIAAAAGTTLTLNGSAFNINANTAGTELHFGSATDTGTVVFAPTLGVVAGGAGYGVFVDGGTLRAGNVNTLTFLTGLSSVNTTVAAGATLDYSPYGSGNINNLLGTGTVLDDGSTTTVRAGTFGGNLAGTQNLVVAANGTNSPLVLTGTNTYTGTTTVNANAILAIGDAGATGSIDHSSRIVDNGTLLYNTSGDGRVNLLTGSGQVIQVGGGKLTLNGVNSTGNDFTGTINVNAGTVLVNGQVGDSTNGLADLVVNSGGTLGGSGTFLGDVTVTGNGQINPGNSPGTLTIAGDLNLGSGTILNYELAQAGVVGGGINDLVVVGGNLTLDGTLNVTALPGFGSGYYRLFNYGGTLTDNGLLFGTVPGGYAGTLFTNIAGQVNVLFNNGSQLVQYWDGTDTTGASSATGGNGGSGTWSSANTNWTATPGYSVNGPWAGQIGVFAGAAGGAVTIAGTQAFQELRFQTGGYTLAGATAADGLSTTGGFSVIDVSSGLAATVNAKISGTGGLTKTGTGQLVLGGANTYTGNTTVSAGRLDLAATGSLTSNVLNSATFTSFGTINGNLVNSGTASVSGQLNGTVSNLAGTLTLANVTGIGAVTQSAGATLSIGSSTTIGSLAGAGSVQIGSALSTLTANGDNSSTTFSGTISGPGQLTKAGTGTLTLAGANTNGSTTVSGGTLLLTAGGSLSGSVLNNATFNNAGTVGGTVTNNGTLTSIGVLNGALNNAGTASLAGQLNNSISNTGTITLLAATTGIGAVSQGASGILNLNGFSTTVGSLAGSGAVQLGSGTLVTNGDNSSTTFAGVISGSGALTKTGTGTLTLSGANTFLGVATVSGGTLALTSSGSLAGPVVNAATVTNAGTIAGVVVNNGALTSTGVLNGGLANAGTASLAGQLNGALSNSAGRVTLTSITTGIGTATQAAGATFDLNGFNTTVGSLAGAGSVTSGGATLTTNGDNSSTAFAGVISGAGGLTKAGTGVLVLTGANTYTGTTTIAAGALVLGSGGTSGSIGAGAIVDNGILAINRSDAVTLANAISGTGSLQLIGTGTTTLTGVNSYSGGTIVAAGRLVGNSSSLQGAILDNATVEFAQATAGTYAGSLSGTGAVEKTGAGRLVFTGNSSALIGATRILGGELALNGSLANSAVTVASGATLSGVGPIGGLVAQSGSIVSPGNGVGTLTVNGNVAFMAGSTYRAEIAPAGADRIGATGTAQLAGTLAVTNLGGNFTIGSSYVLLDAAGGRTGTFDTTTGVNSFGNQFRARIVYTPTQVQLLLASNILAPLAGSTLTANQAAFVTAYDAAVVAGLNTQPFDALYTLSGTALASATDQLSGGIYPTLVRTTLEDERLVREAVLDRMATTENVRPAGGSVWAQGFGSWGDGDSDGNAAAFERNSKGAIIGLDGGAPFIGGGEFRAGVFGHYVETDLDVDTLGSHAQIKRAGGGVYLSTTFGSLNANAGISFSDVRSDVTRSIAFGTFAAATSSHPDGTTIQAFGELSYRLPLGAAAFVEPFASASIARAKFDNIAESGATQSVHVAGQDDELGTVDLGLRAGTAVGGLRLDGRIAARHWFGDRQIASLVALDLAPQQPFVIRSAAMDDWGVAGGLDASVQLGRVTASASYVGVLSNSATDHTARATVAISF